MVRGIRYFRIDNVYVDNALLQAVVVSWRKVSLFVEHRRSFLPSFDVRSVVASSLRSFGMLRGCFEL